MQKKSSNLRKRNCLDVSFLLKWLFLSFYCVSLTIHSFFCYFGFYSISRGKFLFFKFMKRIVSHDLTVIGKHQMLFRDTLNMYFRSNFVSLHFNEFIDSGYSKQKTDAKNIFFISVKRTGCTSLIEFFKYTKYIINICNLQHRATVYQQFSYFLHR